MQRILALLVAVAAAGTTSCVRALFESGGAERDGGGAPYSESRVGTDDLAHAHQHDLANESGPSSDLANEAGPGLDLRNEASPSPDLPSFPLTYVADVAVCTAQKAPDPQACEDSTGANQMAIDLNDAATGSQYHGYVRFVLDGKLGGRTPTRVSLRLQTTDDPYAWSDQTGEVWQVEAFTLASLSNFVPQKDKLLAADQGAVDQAQVVEWTLPPTVAKAHATLHFGLIPVSDNGVNYWNTGGPHPPLLIIE